MPLDRRRLDLSTFVPTNEPMAKAIFDPQSEPVPTISDDMLIILPVRNVVLFPGVVLPVSMSRERTVAGALEALRAERKVGFLLQRDPHNNDPKGDDLYQIGTAAGILRHVTA